MATIKLDISKAISNTDLSKYSEKIKEIHRQIEHYEGEGSEFLGWKNLSENINIDEIKSMEKKAAFFHKQKIEVLVVIGIGGSYLGARAGIDFVLGHYPSNSETKMEIIFAGESISSTDLAQKLRYVENKSFAINVISKSGSTTEPAIAFRMFRKLLEEKIGVENSKDYIVATTDANKGILFDLAKKMEYKMFVIPDDVGGRFSVLTPVGLFPFACIGLNIRKMLKGAEEASIEFSNENLEDNEAYKYAATRHFLYDKSKKVSEMLISYEPSMNYFLEWWKQLFGESEGKNGKGLLPHSAVFSTDLHSLGQFIQEGSKCLFETILTVKSPQIDLNIVDDEENLDKINYLLSKSVHEINTIAFQATFDAHTSTGGVPNIHIEINKLNEHSFGYLVTFFERAVAMSGYLLEVNPFNQPGVNVYKNNMFKVLKQNN